MKRRLVGSTLLGVLSMAYLAVVEVVGLGATGVKLPADGGLDAVVYLAAVAGGLFFLAPFLGLFAGGLSQLVASLTGLLTQKRVQKPVWAARIYALLLTLPIAFVSANAFKGRWARQLPFNDLLALATGLILLAFGFLGVRLLISVKERILAGRVKPPLAWLGIASLGASVVGLYWADREILPGLYGFFHITLTGCAAGSAFLFFYGAYLQMNKRSKRHWGRLAEPKYVAVVALGALVAGAVSLFHIGANHRRRAAALNRTVFASKGLRLLDAVGLLPSPRAIEPTEAKPIPPPQVEGLRLPGRHVVLISIDALRADRVGIYGAKHGVTPNIDRIFSKGTRFHRAYTPTPQTSYAITGMMTGRYVMADRKLDLGKRHKTLPEALRRFGYKTAAFYPPSVFFIDRKSFESYEKTRFGFGHYVVQYHKTSVDDDAAERTDAVIELVEGWSEEQSGEDDGSQPRSLFVWVHYFDPHHPYDERRGFEHGSTDEGRYLSEVAYVDAQVGRLHSTLKKLLPGAIFVVTADHGEGFGEHSTSAHGTALYDEQIRVPLLVAGPGVPNEVVEPAVELVDLTPTILSLVDVPIPASVEGDDLTPYLAGAPEETMPPAFTYLLIADKHLQAVTADSHKLIRDESAGTLELYDLAADPKEQRPLDVDGEPEARKRASVLLGHLKGWRSRLGRERVAASGAAAPADIDRALRSPDVEKRRLAAREIMADPPERLRALILRLMASDPDPEVRHRCAIAAAGLGVKKAFVPTEHLLERPDLPHDMRFHGAMALAEAGRDSAAPVLAELYGRISEAKTRRVILRRLGKLDGARARKVLLGALGEAGVALQAARALRDLGDKSTIRPLADKLEAPGTQAVLRAAIVRTLGVLDGPAAREALRRRLEKETDPLVVAALLEQVVGRAELRAEGWKEIGSEQLGKRGGFACSDGGCVPEKGATVSVRAPATGPRRGSARRRAARLEVWLVLGKGDGGPAGDSELLLGAKPPEVTKRFSRGRLLLLTGEAKKASPAAKLTFKSWPGNRPVERLLVRTVAGKDLRAAK
jgi:arylsulfatase A-like enzyme